MSFAMTCAAPWLATHEAHWAAAGGRPAGKLQNLLRSRKGRRCVLARSQPRLAS